MTLHAGLALLFLRLHRQERAVRFNCPTHDAELLSKTSPGSFLDLSAQFCRLPSTKGSTPTAENSSSEIRKEPNSSVSPITSPTSGPAFVRLLAAIQGAPIYPCQRGLNHICEAEPCPIALDLSRLEADLKEALEGPGTIEKNGHKLGRDEVLVGRAGMVWALGYLASTMSSMPDSALLRDNNIKAGLNAGISKVELLVQQIVSQGALHQAKELSGAIPLLWPWLNDYYGLGAVHGATGILATILSRNLAILAPEKRGLGFPDKGDFQQIIDSVTGVCRESIRDNGHLAMSVPAFPRSSNRKSPLIQICHGSPGLLQLLAIASSNPATSELWRKRQDLQDHSIWSRAFAHASDVVWREGLIVKGGGLCHGIAGNAWPWLTMSTRSVYGSDESLSPDPHKANAEDKDTASTEECLGRALAFLLEARNTRPFIDYDDAGQPLSATSKPPERQYLLPDKPFGLYTGLAGTVAAWAEACVVVVHHMRQMELDKDPGSVREKDAVIAYTKMAMLGFPGLS